MWVDKVVTELTVAVMFSFREAGMGMVSVTRGMPCVLHGHV